MKARTAVRLAWGIGAFSAAGVIASLVLLALDWRAISDPFAAQVPWFINAVITGALGVLIATRRPRNPIAWLLLAISVGNAVNLVACFVAMRGLLAGVPATGWVEWPAWLFNWTGGAGAGLLAFLIIFFPNGKLPSHRWRGVVVFGVIVDALNTAASILDTGPTTLSSRLPDVPSPINIAGFSGGTNGTSVVSDFLNFSPLVLLAITVAAVVIRFRHSEGDQRRQLRWFTYAAGAAIAVVLASYPAGSGLGGNLATLGFDLGIGIILPLTIGLAVMKYGLYDLDVFISRTIVYASLAVFITAVYVGIAVGIGELVGSGGRPNLGLSIIATAIVALGFQPLRERVQRVANRLVYGKRATPYEVLSEFSEQVAETYAADEVLPRMARVLQEGAGAERATVWLRSGRTLRPAATHPQSADGLKPVTVTGDALPQMPDASHTVVVEDRGELLGALSVTKRRGEALTPIEQKLVDDLAHQAGLVLKNVGLTQELLNRLDELRTSRQRLVQAQDQERRQLERNLHDGAQQYLVAIKVKLGLVEMLTDKKPDQAAAMLEQLVGDTDEALETLRDLARGIYPPLLADKGLVAALESQGRKATLRVTIEAHDVGRYSQDVEASVYFSVLEALQNVQKYAKATHAIVRLRGDIKEFRFEVEDDGEGFDPATATRGAGLTNMSDRLDALGGWIELSSQSGRGTTVRGAVPVAAPVAVTSQ